MRPFVIKNGIMSKPIFLLRLTRPTTSLIIGVITSVLYFNRNLQNTQSAFLVFVAMYSASGFGFTLNDILDIEKDKINCPKRVLSAGKIKPTTALLSAIFWVILCIVTSYYTSSKVLVVNSIIVSLLAIYSFVNNRYGIIANLITAFCTSLTLILVTPYFQPDILTLTSIPTFLLILAREIVFDIQDIDGDLAVGKSSLPIKLGASKATIIAGLVLTSCTILTIIVGIYFRQWAYILFVSGLGNILIWVGFMYFYNNPTKTSEAIFIRLSRLAFLTIIPGVLIPFD